MIKKQVLKLKGNTAVFIDWANVYGWRKSLKYEVDYTSLFKYFKSLSEVTDIRSYYGTDKNIHSKQFLGNARTLGFSVITKPVKYVLQGQVDGQKIYKRKCDFDLEIGLDCFEKLGEYQTFIFLSGDGDFATLYERLIKQNKQIIVVYTSGHIGREIWEINKGLFKIQLDQFGVFKKSSRAQRPGRD